MSKIGSINNLTDMGSGLYQINFNGTPNRGFVTSDNAVLAPLWYAKVKMRFGTDWNWGSSEYDGGDPYLANNKFFRMWNPGSTKENAYVEFSARENNGCFKFAVENGSGNNSFNKYFAENYKSVLRAGTDHVFEYEFKDNSYFKMWRNGVLIADFTGFTSLTNGGNKRIYCLGLENEWNSGNTHGGNTLTLSEIVLQENKTREQVGGSPTPEPTPIPTPSPVYALKSELDASNQRLTALETKIQAIQSHLRALP